MRSISARTLAAGIGAVLTLGAMVAGPQASARAGGFVAGRPAFNHRDFPRFVGQPLVRPGQPPPVVVSSAPADVNRTFAFEPVRHHRRFFGHGLPLAGIGIAYGPFGAPIADFGTLARPQDTSQAAEGASVCRSETRLVPSEAGGERPITITWCHKG
jgi:hypothetical protein